MAGDEGVTNIFTDVSVASRYSTVSIPSSVTVTSTNDIVKVSK